MAIVKIFIEGGVLSHPNVSVQTMNNTQRLRESFYYLLSQNHSPSQFKLEVEIGGGFKQTIKFFKAQLQKGQDVYLLIDLDGNRMQKKQKLHEFELTDKIYENRVFFMIQEMEAWMLSQPDKIEDCFQHLKRMKKDRKLEDDSTIKDKHPENIVKPSEKIGILLGRYFRVIKRGKERKKKYKKLNDGPILLQSLDLNRLENLFKDVKDFSENINKVK